MPRGKKGSGKEPSIASTIVLKKMNCDECGTEFEAKIGTLGHPPSMAYLCNICLDVKAKRIRDIPKAPIKRTKRSKYD